MSNPSRYSYNAQTSLSSVERNSLSHPSRDCMNGFVTGKVVTKPERPADKVHISRIEWDY